MNRILGLALLVVGIVLLGFGISASESVGSDISRFFSGKPTDKAIWMLLSGVLCTVVGAGSMMFSRHAAGH